MFQRKLESILQKALRKNTDERYQTIKEMLAELRILKANSKRKARCRKPNRVAILMSAKLNVLSAVC